MRHYKTLTWNDRLQIETWLRVKTPIKIIAEQLGVHISTIYREIKRGEY
ncbi:MAG: helix-turn-helix domain-containing protein [Firmicutes bacterium]|nr:helix-turn-helix domain-containing protein [Bacillota bacterium]